jgi:putative heme-binding domain-containing protein
MMLSLTPGALALMPDLKSELWLSLVPMVNLVVLSRDVMLGEASADFAWLAVVSTLLYAAAALGVAARVFGSDAVLYGSQGSWRELWQGRPHRPVPTPAFSLLLLAMMFPTQFVILGIMGRLQGSATALTMIGAMSGFTALLFLVLPLIAVVGRGYQVAPSFALRRPTLQASLAGFCLGIGLWPLVGLSLWGLGQLRAWLVGAQAEDWSDQVVRLAYQQLSGWSEVPLWVLVVALAIVPAVCEELFFRGVLLQSLRQKNSDLFAILASGLAFGLFHFIVESSVAPLRFVVTASLGAVLGWVCVRSGSVWPSVLLHSLNNGILTGLALVRESLSELPNLGNWVAGVIVICLVATGLGGWLLATGRRRSLAPATALWLAGLIGWGGLFPVAGLPVVAAQTDPLGLPAVAEGWEVQRFADDALAHDIHCLAVGPDDEIFVAGPGYVVQLLDRDHDGIADQAWPLPLRPREGPQGLWVERDWVWVVADGGLWQVERRADGAARRFLQLPKTGGEHDFHAVRRGRDGHFYFLAGNHANIDPSFINRSAPVAYPRAGVLGRISPAGDQRQVLVHGMRNAYGFAFALDQSYLLYDSDDERDAGLPWYRPTTLFAARDGQDLGWISRCFKKPLSGLGSSRVLAETGRGSPTGVACQTSATWGPAYFGAVAFADWTFGRVYLQELRAAHPAAPALLLLQSRSGQPLAPTSLEFDRRGNLYVATGGRQTRGGVYRVSRRTPAAADDSPIGSALTQLEAWFRQPAATLDPPAQPAAQAWAILVARHHELAALLQTLTAEGVAAERVAAWETAGRRLLVRDAMFQAASQPLSETDLRTLMDQVVALEPAWAGEALTWLALSGIETSVLTRDFAPPGWKPGFEAWATLDDGTLSRILAQAEASTDGATSVWAFAALAHRNAPPEQTPDRWPGLAAGFAADLKLHPAEVPPTLSWADWLLVWRWALQSPVPHDGQTGPWDYLLRGTSLPQPHHEVVSAALSERWQHFPQSADAWESPELESWQQLLEIQQLLDVDRPSFAGRWLEWFQATSRRETTPPATSPEPSLGWHPVARLQAMVLLAAAEKPWPRECDALVVDFLLHIDRQMDRWRISRDRNWLTRFDDIGRLLCLDHFELTARLAETPWTRPGQVPLLRLLAPAQQIRAVRGLSQSWTAWNAWDVDAPTLDLLLEVSQRWQLSLPEMQEAATMAAEVQEQVTRWRAAQAQHFAARTAAEVAGKRWDLATLEQAVPWTTGDAQRGEFLFTARQCGTCHQRNGRLGPALSGVTRRFSRNEIVGLLLDPDSRITDRYRPTWVQLVDGTLLTGRPVYESTDGLLLEDQTGRLWQLSRDQIEVARPATKSLMPSGLMSDASPQDWADLWAYLQDLP